ncbi:MAG: N-acetylglucosamine-6-phosphate deacetylase, partial [bacterium]
MSRPFVIAADRVVAPEGDLVPGVVEIRGGRITRVRNGPARRADVRVRGFLAPGLIDLQINGAAGVDFATCERAEALAPVGRFLLATGVTGYLPTLITSPVPLLHAALRRWARFAQTGGAPRILGVHIEGPYLNPSYAGAHHPDLLRTPDPAEFAGLLDSAGGMVRLLTLAPELPGAGRVIDLARGRKIAVAAGHTAATFAEAKSAFDAGVRMVTHVFNAMRPLHHREPGIAGASLMDRRVVAGLIADLVHVHPSVIGMVALLKGPSRVALVTDAVAPAGGRTNGALSGRPLAVSDAPRLADGTLAGSLLTLDQAVRNVVSLGIP